VVNAGKSRAANVAPGRASRAARRGTYSSTEADTYRVQRPAGRILLRILLVPRVPNPNAKLLRVRMPLELRLPLPLCWAAIRPLIHRPVHRHGQPLAHHLARGRHQRANMHDALPPHPRLLPLPLPLSLTAASPHRGVHVLPNLHRIVRIRDRTPTMVLIHHRHQSPQLRITPHIARHINTTRRQSMTSSWRFSALFTGEISEFASIVMPMPLVGTPTWQISARWRRHWDEQNTRTEGIRRGEEPRNRPEIRIKPFVGGILEIPIFDFSTL